MRQLDQAVVASGRRWGPPAGQRLPADPSGGTREGAADRPLRDTVDDDQWSAIRPVATWSTWNHHDVDHDARLTAATALITLSSSTDYRDRADAGRSLASFREIGPVRPALVTLLLDVEDTFVTTQTTGALLRCHDIAGASIVAEACGSADAHQLEHISDEVMDILWRPVDQEPARAACRSFQNDQHEVLRVGAARLLEMLDDLADLYHRMNPTK